MTWLKGFDIHPSVYEGAAENMKAARNAKAENERKRLERIAEAKASEKTAALITNVQEILKAHPGVQQEFNYIFSGSGIVPALKAEYLWIEIHKLTDKLLRLQLLAQFKLLENPTYSALVDIATILNEIDPSDGNYRILDHLHEEQGIIYSSVEIRAITAVDTIEHRLSDGEIKNKLLTHLKPLFPDLQTLYVGPTQQANEVSAPQVKPYVGTNNILQGAFLKTFGLDGFKVSSTETTDAQGNDYSFDQRDQLFSEYPHIPFSLALAAAQGAKDRIPSSRPYQAQDRKEPAPGLDCTPPVQHVSYY